MHTASDKLARYAIADAVKDWASMLSTRDMRRMQDDARCQFLGRFIVENEYDEDWLTIHRVRQARILIRVRSCQMTGRRDLAKTVLARATVYAKVHKPVAAAAAAVRASWAADDGADLALVGRAAA